MSRARNIKPSFFDNEALAEIPPIGRLLFIALWCEADREGRLEDRPARLKIRCLPFDDCNVDELLSQLHERGFIVRYNIDGARYIQISQFSKHQNPHAREVSSTIPALGGTRHSLGDVQPRPSTGSARLIPPSLIPLPDPQEQDQSLRRASAPDTDTQTHNSKPEPIIAATTPMPASSPAAATTAPSPTPTSAGAACLAMRTAGCAQTNPSHPALLAALAEGVTAQTLADTVAEALASGITKPFAYAIATARSRHARGADVPPATTTNGAHAHAQNTRKPSVVEQVEQAIAARRRASPDASPKPAG